jgi:hypothetical protein
MTLSRFFFAVIVALLCQVSSVGFAADGAAEADNPVDIKIQKSGIEAFLENFGANYFTFFNGPGFSDRFARVTPSAIGTNQNDGLQAFTNLSLYYMFSKDLGIDFQFRLPLVFNDERPTQALRPEQKEFQHFRWETPRIGISGTLLRGDYWSLKGAFNTNFPYFVPPPIGGGYSAEQLKLVATPGLFAGFSYRRPTSPWSLYAILSPRLFIYSDREAIDIESQNRGLDGGHKREFLFDVTPTVNYDINSSYAIRTGARLQFQKAIMSRWLPSKFTMVVNEDSDAWRFLPLEIPFGIYAAINERIQVYPHVLVYPLASQRVNAKTGEQAGFIETASLQMWLSGTIF